MSLECPIGDDAELNGGSANRAKPPQPQEVRASSLATSRLLTTP
jgi:hypothetical protein